MKKEIMKNTKNLVDTIRNISSITHKKPDIILRDVTEYTALLFSMSITPFYEESLSEFVDVSKVRLNRFQLIDGSLQDNIRVLYVSFIADLVKAFEVSPYDYLGEIAAEFSSFNDGLGQFMTSGSIAHLASKILLPKDNNDEASTDNIRTINDPACGTGGLIINIGKEYMDKGINYQPITQVFCSDIDLFMVHCCYIQLTLMSFEGSVIHSDTLKGKPFTAHDMWILPYSVVNGESNRRKNENEIQYNKLKELFSDFL